ncbi:MAG: hypothetical protein JSV96_05295 [Candidatus Aminicenantes bacterium]|nr:MAG: hypothetical protein JSV96_05295 [Candidatus Aminicenantes bacterium]
MAAQENGKVHYVDITRDNGNFKYSNDSFEVERGDFIEWSCEETNGEDYTVIFQKTPFYWKEKEKKCGQKIKDKIKEEAEDGEYKYKVSVNDGQNVWTDDSIFIVK